MLKIYVLSGGGVRGGGGYDTLIELFNVTNVNGQLLSTEDKHLYYLQVERKEVGYSTDQIASEETIHPSKR